LKTSKHITQPHKIDFEQYYSQCWRWAWSNYLCRKADDFI